MKRFKFFCDKCGLEIEDSVDYKEWVIRGNIKNETFGHAKFERNKGYCIKCANELAEKIAMWERNEKDKPGKMYCWTKGDFIFYTLSPAQIGDPIIAPISSEESYHHIDVVGKIAIIYPEEEKIEDENGEIYQRNESADVDLISE